MSTTEGRVSATELRRRARANQALQAKTQELEASEVLSKRQAAKDAADAKEAADLAAREAVAAALRLFDNDVELISQLLEVPTEELLERGEACYRGSGQGGRSGAGCSGGAPSPSPLASAPAGGGAVSGAGGRPPEGCRSGRWPRRCRVTTTSGPDCFHRPRWTVPGPRRLRN